MSLEALRQLRLAGAKPGQAVFVLIGGNPDPRALGEEAATIVVKATDQPALMDWRPLVGLTVAVFELEPLPALQIAVLDALQACEAKVFGVVDELGVHPLLEGADETHERLLRRGWEQLCR